MTHRSSRLEIYIKVLKWIGSGGSRPDDTMYKCNLLGVSLRQILRSLARQNLIRVVEKENRRTYEITRMGLNVVRYFEKTQDSSIAEGGKEEDALRQRHA